AACLLLSSAQRALSTPVRRLRRSIDTVEGRIVLRDGSVEPLDSNALRTAPEAALRILSVAVPLLAVAVLVARVM
ncbi:MAG: hypothetical protein ABR518_05135, partial [Actinomycetota bacterium]